MIVTAGTDWQTIGGGRRHYSISLDESDGEVLIGTDKWVEMSWPDKKKSLDKLAQLHVLKFMYDEGAIDVDEFKTMAQAVKNK